MSMITCGICYGIVTIDKKPVQCCVCRNVIFCGSCSVMMKGQCCFCKSPDSKFIPIDNVLLELIQHLHYRC